MTKREKLEQIIDLETPHAEDVCPRARGLVVNAQAELQELNQLEWLQHAFDERWEDEEERNWRSEERNWGVEKEDA